MIFPFRSLKTIQHLVLVLGILSFFYHNVSQAQLIDPERKPLINKSYFNNKENVKKLYQEGIDQKKEEYRVRMPSLPIVSFIVAFNLKIKEALGTLYSCLLYTSPSPRD